MLDCHYYFNDAKRIDNRSQRRIINSTRPGCLNGLYPAETQPVLADRRDGLYAPGYSGNLLKEAVKRLNTLTFLNFFVAMILLRPQVFFLWSFWRWFAIWTSRGFVRIVRPANRRPGTTLPVFPWSPRCKTGVLPQGGGITAGYAPTCKNFCARAGIFSDMPFFSACSSTSCN